AGRCHDRQDRQLGGLASVERRDHPLAGRVRVATLRGRCRHERQPRRQDVGDDDAGRRIGTVVRGLHREGDGVADEDTGGGREGLRHLHIGVGVDRGLGGRRVVNRGGGGGRARQRGGVGGRVRGRGRWGGDAGRGETVG